MMVYVIGGIKIAAKKVTKKVKVSKYTRKNKKGKRYKVKPHKRKVRKLGKKIRYKTVGKFQVAHDNLGNFRGSRVLKYKTIKPLKLKVKKPVKRKLRSKRIKRKRPSTKLVVPKGASTKEVDTLFYLGKIGEDTWLEKRRKITN